MGRSLPDFLAFRCPNSECRNNKTWIAEVVIERGLAQCLACRAVNPVDEWIAKATPSLDIPTPTKPRKFGLWPLGTKVQ